MNETIDYRKYLLSLPVEDRLREFKDLIRQLRHYSTNCSEQTIGYLYQPIYAERLFFEEILSITEQSHIRKNEPNCEHCSDIGYCDICDMVDGRDTEVVNEYASTCDGCHKLALHVDMFADVDNFGYCKECQERPKDIFDA